MDSKNDQQMGETIDEIADDMSINVNFDNFLASHVAAEDKPFTHVAYGPPWARYFIADNEYNKFINMYKKICGKRTMHLIEKQKNVGPFILDLDFRQDKKYSKRQYQPDHINAVTRISISTIKKYYNVTDYDLEAFIFEKDSPSYDEKRKNYKDGFHIVFPLPIDFKMRYYMLEEIKEKVKSEKIFDNIPYINKKGLDDIFDICVVMRNGWLLYGCRKYDGKKYQLTYIYDSMMEKKNIETYSDDELVAHMSVRKFADEDVLKIREKQYTAELKKKLEEIYEKYHGNKNGKKVDKKTIKEERISEKIERNNKVKPSAKTSNIKMAKQLVKLLSDNRASAYHEWTCVGWALHSIDESLLEDFIEFSKRCPDKYEDGCCERIWRCARDCGLTMASLYWWAKNDNPDGYTELIRRNINEIIQEAETGTHDDIAKVVYEMYKHIFKCVSIKKNIWYEFQKHRWVRIDSAYSLSKKLSDEITKEFSYLVGNYFMQSSGKNGIEKDAMFNKAKNVTKIIERLKNTSFKNLVIEACAVRFHDPHFEEILDDNKDIIGFNNGVYDLKLLCFRPGVPDDFITLSVGYDYKEYTMDDPLVKSVIDYFEKVQYREDMRKYVLLFLSSVLDGHNRNQKFILWTGTGKNGKSTTVDLVQYAMGDYFGVLAPAVLTTKRKSSSGATPELANKRGKRFLVIQEPEQDETVYVGQMKNLTGSDWIEARALYGDPFMYKPQFKMALICNRMPEIKATDGGTWRRVRVVLFDSEFVEDPKKPNQFLIDNELPEKLKIWAPALMWLLLNEYYPEYRKKGIAEPALVTQFTDKYKKDSDMFHAFLNEHYVITGSKKDRESIQVVYEGFRDWHKQTYASAIPPKKELANYLQNVDKIKCISGEVIGIKTLYDNHDKENNDDDKESSHKLSNKLD